MSEQELAEKEANRTGVTGDQSGRKSHSRSRKSMQARSLAEIMGDRKSSNATSRRASMDQRSRSQRSSVDQRSESEAETEDVEAAAAADEAINVQRGMILPFEPLSISFDDVSYYVDMPAVSVVAKLSFLSSNTSDSILSIKVEDATLHHVKYLSNTSDDQ